MIKDKDRITASKVAEILNIDRSTLRKIIKQNEDIQQKNLDDLTIEEKKFRCPPYARIGTMIIFSRKKIEKFMEEINK